MKLYTYQKDFVLRLLDKMYETYGLKEHVKWVDDVVILGSLTTTKWLLSSDLDVHVRVNLDEFIKTNMPNASKEEAFAKLDETRKEFDRAKILAPMTQHPTEFYFESIELHASNTEAVGVYSLYQDKWLKEPIILPAELDIEESKRKVVEEAEALAQELDGSLGKVKRDIQRIDELENVIKAWGKEKQKLFYSKIEKKLNDIEEEIKKDLKIKQDLVDYRHSNQDPTSENEILFKYLARNGFFAILQNLKELLESTGGEVTTDELPLIEKVISQANLKEAGQVMRFHTATGKEFRVFKDPSPIQAEQLFNNSVEKSLRYILDDTGIYMWDAYYASHEEMQVELGLGNVNRIGYIENGAQARKWSSVFNKEKISMQKFAAFMTKAQVKPVSEDNPALGQLYIDLDDTLATENPDGSIGNLMEGAKEALETLKQKGWNIVVFSYRSNVDEDSVKEFLDKNKLPYDSIFIGKPAYQVLVDDRAIKFNNNWKEIAQEIGKPEKKAALHIKAAISFWIDPNGKVYSVYDTHEDWILSNTKLLQEQYGLWKNHPEELYPEETDNTKAILPMMLRDGWVRVGDLFGTGRSFIGKGIEIADLNNLPSSVSDFISNWGKDKYFIIEDLHKNWVELSVEELMADGQEAVNRAMQRGKMVHASIFVKSNLPKTFWIAPDGKPYPVEYTHDDWIYKNLSLLKQTYGIDLQRLFKKELEKSPDKIVKYLINNGWVRVASAGNGRDYVVEVDNIRQIPTYAIDYLLGGISEDAVVVFENEDLTESVQVSKEELARGQNAINRAIRTQIGASKLFSKKEITAGNVINIENYKIYKNPSVEQTKALFAKYHALRGVIDPLTFDFYIWDAMDLTHWDVNSALSIDLDLDNEFNYQNYTWIGDNESGIASLYEKVQNAKKIKPEANLKQAQTKKVKQGDYSCLMALVPHDLAQEIVEWGVRTVPDDKLYLDEDGKLGRELESHITIKYGLLTNDAKHVRRSFNNEKPLKAKLGKVKHFQPPELPFDVLTVEVISEDLEKANKKVCDSFECAEGLISDEYHPHITVCYMKRDTAKEYIGSDVFKDKELELDTLVFSPHKGNRTYFSISNDKESRFILEQINKKSSGNNFYPSLVQAPNNTWQFEHGGDDLEIPVDPDPISDEETYYAPCTVGKPRNPDMWKQLWHMIKSPFSKKEVESAADTEQEAIEQKELGGETLLEYTKHFKDLNRLDTNKPKTTWEDNSSSQGGEPYVPLPSFHVETNPDNENWRYPWKYVRRPIGEDSDQGKIIEMLEEQEKRKACIERITKPLEKVSGTYSASVPDYQGEQYYNEQHMNDTDCEPYVNHDQRYISWGYHDSPENTDSGIGWAKDNSPQTVFLDVMEKAFDRRLPSGIPWYSVEYANALPMSSDFEVTNPD